MSLGGQVSYVHDYYRSIPNLSALCFIQPDLVLVSPFVGLWPLFMLMFHDVSLLMAQSSLSSDTINLESVFGLCCMGMLWALASHLSFSNMVELPSPAQLILPLWKCPPTIQSFFNLLPEVLHFCYWCTVYVSHIVHYYPTIFHHSDDEGLPLVISAIHFSTMLCVHSPLSSHWTTTVDPIGKENESFQVSLPLLCLSWHVFKALYCSLPTLNWLVPYLFMVTMVWLLC